MNEKTNWMGLWYQREGVYSGNVITKKDIPPYARLIVRFNRYYQKDSKRPRFVYCFASGDSANAITVKRTTEEFYEVEDLFTPEEVQRIIDMVAYDLGGDEALHNVLLEDYAGRVRGYE